MYVVYIYIYIGKAGCDIWPSECSGGHGDGGIWL